MRHPIIILPLFLIFECFNGNAQTKPFRKILPDTSKTQRPNWFYDEALNFSRELNLFRIDHGVDSFALRIWVSSNGTPDYLFSLYYENNNWFATKTFYWPNYPAVGEKGHKENDWMTLGGGAKMIVDSSHTFRIKPLIDFSKVIDTIKQFNILNIPTEEEIPNLDRTSIDGYNYTFEIATKNYYKIINYSNPKGFPKEYPYNRKIGDLLRFLSTYFTHL